ncbi:MAG: protein-export membrane protein SecF [Candidatus Terrybacteria bacterium RIFCSPHIGHO2_01_FULL_48_17]|uniref:Protein-export membrane protein SecF n=1 Tax=Candidatus Terrybacteria bacterium RIFCSPHIGHO2_01_FULL_48_17 TaxID=1802362 RepID=A0A1G2PLB4_9BACT|nr:MAG: protein-export membrane protein SecF [Candidatus Terrybacteria bacterium RIFCSPHIGHO2_01_FULL_48_17]OHA53043.1 MAG: protein-export membrane protein SecF [Candidatus Terrybacteria bacterium RIFCSPLOWO2_01_FULL_48_14]
MNLPIIQNRKYFFILSISFVVVSVAALMIWGLRFGIEFTGGSQLEIRFAGSPPDNAVIFEKIKEVEGINEVLLQPTANQTTVVRLLPIDENTHQAVLAKLNELGDVQELQFASIGPVIGSELRQKGIVAVVAGLFAIMLYIAWAFRAASRPVRSWQYGLVVALVGLLHDVLIPVGAFAALGHFMKLELGVPFIAAILTVLGFSVHDTIVVFDRTRENLRRIAKQPFEHIVNVSVNQTLGRSLNTSMTLVFMIVALLFFGGESLRSFALVILVGTIVGTYSSIFIASPLLVELSRFKLPRRR